MIAIGPMGSEELRSQSITILILHEKVQSPIAPTKIVEFKWLHIMINYTSSCHIWKLLDQQPQRSCIH